MSVQKRIEVLSNIGEQLQSEILVEELSLKSYSSNAWFEPRFVLNSLKAISEEYLQHEKLSAWLKPYHIENEISIQRKVGIICAGNVPLVGLHDFLSCYVLGIPVQLKLSSKDTFLMRYIIEAILKEDSEYRQRFAFVERLVDFDAVIATGSNTTNRYFEHYFSKYPNILRSNRVSAAVLRGSETQSELKSLADDIFMYFGLGCRNVAKLYVPLDYQITNLFEAFKDYQWLHHNSQYMNNYDYNRTLWLMNKTEHLANDFVMLQENESIHSPISALFYSYYKDEQSLAETLEKEKNNLQCVVGNAPNETPFGKAQKPGLSDYADGKDVIGFLLTI